MPEPLRMVSSSFLEDGYWGECSCGWRGPTRYTAAMAEADVRAHECSAASPAVKPTVPVPVPAQEDDGRAGASDA